MSLLLLASWVPIGALAGCGGGAPSKEMSDTLHLAGAVHGGQQPVAGSVLQLYNTSLTAGPGGAIPMLRVPVSSDANGHFDISGDYTCSNADDQLLLVAHGGNPGMATGTNNAALTMVTAVGRCGDLMAATTTDVTEMTTVAAAWALVPFLSSATNVLAGPTNGAGLRNGYLNARLLADASTGGPAMLPAGLTVESGKVLALANALASCVNTADGSGCTPLFSAATPAGGKAPADTFTAALDIVKNPANQVAAVYNMGSAVGPFPGGLMHAPSDWTMSVSVTGGGLNQPSALAVDGYGNIWSASYAGVLSAFSPQGLPLSAAGYGGGVLSQVLALTIDPGNNIWVTIANEPKHGSTYGSLAEFAGAGSSLPGQMLGTFSDSTLDYPSSLAADSNGKIFVANYTSSLVSIFNGQGTVLSSGLGAGATSFPLGLAVDASHGFWLANYGDNTVSHLDANGTLLARPQCCDGANAIALDAGGNAWVANHYESSISEVTAAGTLAAPVFTGGGINEPGSVAIDGAQDVWVANSYAGSLSHLGGNRTGVTPGAALSAGAGLGLDARLLIAANVAVDASGDVWVADGGRNVIVVFLGLAAPTRTPQGPIPTAP